MPFWVHPKLPLSAKEGIERNGKHGCVMASVSTQETNHRVPEKYLAILELRGANDIFWNLNHDQHTPNNVDIGLFRTIAISTLDCEVRCSYWMMIESAKDGLSSRGEFKLRDPPELHRGARGPDLLSQIDGPYQVCPRMPSPALSSRSHPHLDLTITSLSL